MNVEVAILQDDGVRNAKLLRECTAWNRCAVPEYRYTTVITESTHHPEYETWMDIDPTRW